MRQKIQNTFVVEVEGVDLKTVSNIEFYLRQKSVFFQYTPIVTESNEMMVTVPKKDADLLNANMPVRLQFAYTDENGNPQASDPTEVNVGVLLKDGGYDGR